MSYDIDDTLPSTPLPELPPDPHAVPERPHLSWLAGLLAVCLLAVVAGGYIAACAGAVPACPAGQIRAWCLLSVELTTWAELEESGRTAQSCPAKQFSVTTCVQNTNSMGKIMDMVSRVNSYIERAYWSNSYQQFLMTDDGILRAKIAKDADGYAECNSTGQQANPWPGNAIVNIDLGYASQRLGAGGAGGGAAADCSSCLADGCAGVTDPVAIAQCSQQHCAALCPLSASSIFCGAGGTASGTLPAPVCAGSGAPCDAQMLCCVGYACMADGTCQ